MPKLLEDEVGLQASFCCCYARTHSYTNSSDPSAWCLLAEGGDNPGSPEVKYVYLTQPAEVAVTLGEHLKEAKLPLL